MVPVDDSHPVAQLSIALFIETGKSARGDNVIEGTDNIRTENITTARVNNGRY